MADHVDLPAEQEFAESGAGHMEPDTKLLHRSFGADAQTADELLALVLKGRKTATCGPLWEYETEGVAMPKPGERSVIMDRRGVPKCIVEMIEVTHHSA